MACSACHKTRAAILSALAGGKDSIAMDADYTHKVAGIHIKYVAGAVYSKVPSIVSMAIVAANAGHVLDA